MEGDFFACFEADTWIIMQSVLRGEKTAKQKVEQERSSFHKLLKASEKQMVWRRSSMDFFVKIDHFGTH